MKPVFQTRFGDQGNCMQATVASVLELPLSAVPDFGQLIDYDTALRDFFNMHGADLKQRGPDFDPIGYYIVTGVSDRGGEHAVVWRQGRLVHDPHPGGRGLAWADGVLWPRAQTDFTRVLLGQ